MGLIIYVGISCGGYSQPGVNGNRSSTLKATGESCSGGQGSEKECEGALCLDLTGENNQGPNGMCSKLCSGDNDCKQNEVCLIVQEGEGVCLKQCSTDRDCQDGFVCNVTAKICWIDSSQPQGDGGAIDCTASPCNGSSYPDSLNLYCNDVLSTATKLCDCSGTSPSNSCRPASGANLYCCP